MLQRPSALRHRVPQGLNQNRGLNRHVQGSSNAGALKGFSLPNFAQRHQTGHLGLGNVEFFAAEISLIDIGNDAIDAELELSRDVALPPWF